MIEYIVFFLDNFFLIYNYYENYMYIVFIKKKLDEEQRQLIVKCDDIVCGFWYLS